LSAEHNAIASYNISLAGLQYAKGTLMQYNNVVIADGPLPNCTLARATDHQRQRTDGIVVRERATPPAADGPNPLPSLLEHQPPTPDVPAELKLPPAEAPRMTTEQRLPVFEAPKSSAEIRVPSVDPQKMPASMPIDPITPIVPPRPMIGTPLEQRQMSQPMTLPPTGRPTNLPVSRPLELPR